MKDYGISHFGVRPTVLRHERIRFDTFHLKCSITKRFMGYLRHFNLNQSTHIMELTSKLLSTFWTEFHAFIFK